MTISKMAVLLGVAAVSAIRTSVDMTPLAKVQALLGDLRAKVIEEGTTSEKVAVEFEKNCDARIQQIGFDLKTGKSNVDRDRANIEKATGTEKVQQARAAKATETIAKNEAALKSAAAVRANETQTYLAQEAELVEMSAMLQRAISVLSSQGKEAAKSFAQVEGGEGLTQALAALVEATAVSNAADAEKLHALLQSNEDAEEDLLAPPKRSGQIITVLEDLLSRSTTNLADLRKAEVAAKHNFALVQSSLESEAKAAKKDLADATSVATQAREQQATAKGDLAKDTQQVATDTSTLKSFTQDCEDRKRDFKEEVQNRKEEIAALDKASQILAQTTGAAAASLYKSKKTSFLQVRGNKFAAVRLVSELARKEHSASLAQLAAHMSAVVHLTGSADPFEKVKGLIKSMLTKLQEESKAEASQKAFCDGEMKKTESSLGGKSSEANKLKAKIDQAKSRSATLKQEAAALTAAISEIEKSQAAINKQRVEEKALYNKNVPEMENGIKGVQLAIGVIRDFYSKTGKKKAERAGASTGIVGMLETVEADFSKNLAETKAAEADAQKTYTEQSQKNKIDKASKGEEIKFKTKEAGEVDVSVSQIEGDIANVQTELKAITEYLEKLKGQCIAKPEPYEERAKRREQEIAGLKNAIEILNSQ